MTTFNERLAAHNRYRMRATALSMRAVDIIDQPGQFLRALRIHDRATRSARRADEALRTLSVNQRSA
jgi:hypothetical protein